MTANGGTKMTTVYLCYHGGVVAGSARWHPWIAETLAEATTTGLGGCRAGPPGQPVFRTAGLAQQWAAWARGFCAHPDMRAGWEVRAVKVREFRLAGDRAAVSRPPSPRGGAHGDHDTAAI